MPDEVRNLCRLADIHSKSLLLQIVRQGDPQKMVALVEKIASEGGATREEVRKETAKPKPGRPKAYVFSFKAPTKAFNLQLQVHEVARRSRRSHRALEAIIANCGASSLAARSSGLGARGSGSGWRSAARSSRASGTRGSGTGARGRECRQPACVSCRARSSESLIRSRGVLSR